MTPGMGRSLSDTELRDTLSDWLNQEAEQFQQIGDRFSELDIDLYHNRAFSVPLIDGSLRMIATRTLVNYGHAQPNNLRQVKDYHLIINRTYKDCGKYDHTDITDYVVSLNQTGSILRLDSRANFDESGNLIIDNDTGPIIFDKDSKANFSAGQNYLKKMAKHKLSRHDAISTKLLLEQLASFSNSMEDPI